MTTVTPCLVRAVALAERDEVEFHHPLTPASDARFHGLSRLTGLTRTGVSRVRVPPRKESFVYHAHRHEEEWLYVLAGRGVAEIDGREYEVGPGDFMGFPTPSVAHHLRNPFDEDLVYLMDGEHRDCEVADYPRLGMRFVRTDDEMRLVETEAMRPFARASR